MTTDSLAAATALLVKRLDERGRISDEKGRLTRTFLSPAMRRANALVVGWMREAGLSVREDAVGNVIGRLESPVPAAKTLFRQRQKGGSPSNSIWRWHRDTASALTFPCRLGRCFAGCSTAKSRICVCHGVSIRW